MEAKFTNFKAFVAQHIPNHPVNWALAAMDLNTFLCLIATQLASHPTAGGQKIHLRVLSKLCIDPAAFDASALDRFELYCDYFSEAVAVHAK